MFSATRQMRKQRVGLEHHRDPRAAGGSAVTSRPPIIDAARRRPVEPRDDAQQVVLPQPDGPSSTQKLPGATSSDTPASACTSPQARVMRRNSRMAAPRFGND